MITMLFAAVIPVIWAAPCFAAESSFKEIFLDALYGGLAGSLVGAAVMAFAKKPGNHLDYLGYGAAGGVLVGTAFGLGRMAKSLAELDEQGKVKFAFPAVIPTFQEVNYKGQGVYGVNTQILSGKF
jgi:hypothetical protein